MRATVPATRAASHLIDTGRIRARFSSEEVALVIDAETGIPELLDAAEQAIRRIERLNIGGPEDIGEDPTLVKLRAAVAKAQGK